jgi:hypothetical protein
VAESLIRPTRKHIFETMKMSRLFNPGDGRITRLKAALERGDDTTVWRGHTAPRVQPVPSTTPEDPHLVDGSQNFLARKEMFDVLSSGLTTQHRKVEPYAGPYDWAPRYSYCGAKTLTALRCILVSGRSES